MEKKIAFSKRDVLNSNPAHSRNIASSSPAIIFIVKTASKKIQAFICSVKFLFPNVVPYLHKFTT